MLNSNFSSLFLTSFLDLTFDLGWILLFIGGAALAFVLTFVLLKRDFKNKHGTFKEMRDRLIAEAMVESKTIKKEAILEAKEQELKLRSDFERDSKEKRA